MFLAPIFSSAGVDTGDIGHSLRFRSGAGAYLSRVVVAGSPDPKRWTAHFAVKRGALGSQQALYSAQVSAGSSAESFYFNAANQLQWSDGGAGLHRTSTAVFRDIVGFYFITLHYDSANAVDADRIRVEVNGAAITFTGSSIALNRNSYFTKNATNPITLGAFAGIAGSTFDGYIARFCKVDGSNYAASNFGYLNTEINEWVTKTQSEVKAVVDAGGTNSFMLDFDDGSSLTTLGYDKSSKGNNWTLNNFSLTAGSTYDWMDDTPTNNFAVLNPIDRSNASMTVSAGNLDVSTFASFDVVRSSFTLSSGKWYWEITGTSTYTGLGVSRMDVPVGSSGHTTVNGWYVFADTGNKWTNNSESAYISGGYSGTDVIGIALDCDAGTITFYKNNTSQGTAFTGLAGLPLSPVVTTGLSVSTAKLNFGQRPFAYSPPAGFKALCTKNLPTPSILNPKKHFDVVLATGANIKSTAEAVFPGNFLEWIKDRGNANNHQLIDTVRGTSAVLQSNTTGAETTYSAPSGSSVGWTWKAGGAAVTNNAGSIQSQVSANVEAGFSIVTYTGTGANATVGHGLSKAPKMVILKKRIGGPVDWHIYHANANALPANGRILFNTAAWATDATAWNNTVPSSSVVTLGSSLACNNTETYVAYCFAEIEGYSKIGSYTGNGSADGPYVHCGFKPRFILIKRIDVASDWTIFDTARDTYNAAVNRLFPNLALAETTGVPIDITSNGFKPRDTGAAVNASGGTYIYYAIADVSGKYSLGR